jgi:hypothetical protein
VSWTIGSVRGISWSHNLGAGERVRIDLSRDGGATWTPLIADVANSGNASGTYSWMVTGPATTSARIRVTWLGNGAAEDAGNVNFRIQ